MNNMLVCYTLTLIISNTENSNFLSCQTELRAILVKVLTFPTPVISKYFYLKPKGLVPWRYKCKESTVFPVFTPSILLCLPSEKGSTLKADTMFVTSCLLSCTPSPFS